MGISLKTVIIKTTTASEKSAWDSQRLSKTTPLTAAETKGCARNTRKTSNPLWLRVFIPQQCLPIFSVDAKTQSFHCSWQGPSCPGWCWWGTSLTAITYKCIYLLLLTIAKCFLQKAEASVCQLRHLFEIPSGKLHLGPFSRSNVQTKVYFCYI